MTDIEKTEGEIKVLQAKLELLKEMENHKSPAEEAYKNTYGMYPMGEPFWVVFKKGYEAHQSLVDDANKIKAEPSMINCIIRGNPPNGCSSWSEWFELFGSKGILHNLNISAKEYQPTEPQTLYDALRKLDRPMFIDDVLGAVDKWLPKEHDTNSDGWNKCVRMLREKLR